MAQEELERQPDRVVHKRKTIIEFSDLRLNGTVVGPSSVYITSRRRAGFTSLIRLRANFLPEILVSVNQLE